MWRCTRLIVCAHEFLRQPDAVHKYSVDPVFVGPKELVHMICRMYTYEIAGPVTFIGQPTTFKHDEQTTPAKNRLTSVSMDSTDSTSTEPHDMEAIVENHLAQAKRDEKKK